MIFLKILISKIKITTIYYSFKKKKSISLKLNFKGTRRAGQLILCTVPDDVNDSYAIV